MMFYNSNDVNVHACRQKNMRGEGGVGFDSRMRGAVTTGFWVPLKVPQKLSGIWGEKSCILAIWRKLISVWKSSIFSLLISFFPIKFSFKTFFQFFFQKKRKKNKINLPNYLQDSCLGGRVSSRNFLKNGSKWCILSSLFADCKS